MCIYSTNFDVPATEIIEFRGAASIVFCIVLISISLQGSLIPWVAGKLDGHAISEFDADGLVLLIQRGDEEIIPHGDTVLRAGDTLVILKSR